MKNNKNPSAGFTLIEIAIVITIGAVMILGAGSMLKNYLRTSRAALTKSRIEDIDRAISQYLVVNGALPCPARLNDAVGAVTFGKSITDGLTPVATAATSPNDCYNQSASPSTLKMVSTLPSVPATGKIIIGAVPVSSLNLPDAAIADAWGDRFIYAVTDDLTIAGNYDPTKGAIGLQDGAGTPIVGSTLTPPYYAQYVILSHGPNRAGAYTVAGAQTGTACPAAAAALERTNCNFPTQMFRKTMQISTQAGNNYFDDYVIYHSQMDANATLIAQTPSGMVAPFASTTGVALTLCPPGWKKYTGTAASCTAPTLPVAGLCCERQ